MKEEHKKEQKERGIVYEEEQAENVAEDLGEENDLDILRSKIRKLKDKLKKCNEEKQEYLAGWQRAKADLINFKRRQEEQLREWQKLFNEKLVFDILPVIDSFEAQSQHITRNITDENTKKHETMLMIFKQLKNVLQKHGLEEIKAVGEKFNPEFHEAIEQVESDKKEGIIVEEVQKGYMLNGKVIRTTKVKVTKKI